jgi:hypothetical protein
MAMSNQLCALATGQKSPTMYWQKMIVSLRVSLNVMTMITIPAQVNYHHAGMINIFSILNNISQTGRVSAFGG